MKNAPPALGREGGERYFPGRRLTAGGVMQPTAEAVLDPTGIGRSDAASTTPPDAALFVIPTRRGDGFRASVRGRMLDLADPDAGDRLAPTPDDLFLLSIASALAWSARAYLRAHELAGEVSVSAEWRTHDDPRMGGIDATVTVSNGAKTTNASLAAALEDSIAARPLRGLLRFRVCAEPGDSRWRVG
jgi:uncharacterized OsmC-like protein